MYTGFDDSESDSKVDIADNDYIFISHRAVYLIFQILTTQQNFHTFFVSKPLK